MPDVTKQTISAGIYRDMDSATYFEDPCPEPSLSQSIAKILIDRSPHHAMILHPRLCPASVVDDEFERYDKAKAIGNAAHKIILGRGKDLEIIVSNDFRSKAAKDARDTAYLSGKEPVLEKHMATASEMVAAAWSQLQVHEAKDALTGGAGEVALIWQEDGLWFRSLVDWLHDDLRTVDDYKSGGVSVAPHVIGLRMVDQGWDIQAAMIERGLDVLDPKGAGRRRFRFIAQENERPFALTVCQLSESVMTMGRKKLQAAIGIWRQCIEAGEWPGYVNRVISPEYPGWQESRWLEREVNGEFEKRPVKRVAFDPKNLMAG